MAKDTEKPDSPETENAASGKEEDARRMAKRREQEDAMLDEALKDTFPASDPIPVGRLWKP